MFMIIKEVAVLKFQSLDTYNMIVEKDNDK